jgi:glycosyltransferase involved in cell wall biosynthesis
VQHPYLTHLYYHLSKIHFNITLFLFNQGDWQGGERLVGDDLSRLEAHTYYRLVFSVNPLTYVKPMYSILSNIAASIQLYTYCRKHGYNFRQSLGQLIYNYQLLGKKFDLIYINALQSARHFCLKGMFPSVPIIASSRGQDFDFHPSAYDQVLKDISHLHVLGNYLKQKATERGFLKENITQIPPAQLPYEFYKKKKTADFQNIRIISATRLVWTKGLVYAIRAVAKLIAAIGTKYNVEYIIYGDGEDMAYLKCEVTRLGINDKVKFKGWADQLIINEEVSLSDIYLLPSIEEGFNNSVLQAQALGIPCVVSNAGGLPENVLDGVTGMVVNAYSSAEICEALKQLIEDRDLRIDMGVKGSERVKRDFQLSNQVEKYAAMMNTVLNENT